MVYVLQYLYAFLVVLAVLSVRSLWRRYDAVQVNTMPDFLVFATLVPRLLGSRILLDLHEPMPELFVTKYGPQAHPFLVRLQAWIEQWAIRYAHHALTVNNAIRERFIERGADGAKISVVRNVPGEQLGDGAAAARPPADGFVLMTHGSLEARYGHATVIRALPLLKDQIPGLQFHTLGVGAGEEELRALAAALGCADIVRFPGVVPQAELADALARADVGLVPLEPSPFSDLCQPNKLFDYVAVRVPVVAARLPAIEETFDATCLAYYAAGDSADLARCILELHRGPERRRRLAEAAFRRYEEVRWRVAKHHYVGIVEDLVAGRRPVGAPGP